MITAHIDSGFARVEPMVLPLFVIGLPKLVALHDNPTAA
jgi:hypothetical protein